MRKEKQIGVRVGLPAFFALELEDVYKRTEGAHRALAFPDFIGLLVGIGLEQYKKGNSPAPIGNGGAPEGKDTESVLPNEESPESGLANRAGKEDAKEDTEEGQLAEARIIPFPGVSLPDDPAADEDRFFDRFEGFLQDMGYIE